MKSKIILSISFLVATFQFPALAQVDPNFPSKPVTFVVSQAAGGPTDVEARIFAGKMAEIFGQSFVTENRPGATAAIGIGYVVKSKPDGYTLSAMGGGLLAYEALHPNAYPSSRDLSPISLVSQRANVLVVPSSLPVKNLQEYFAYAKANPGKINFATSGAGGGVHLAGAWLHSGSGSQATFVHYKGAGAVIADLQAGRVQATTYGMVLALPLIKAGKLRAIAIMNKDRSDLMPDLPTVAESGIPGFNYSAWLGFAGPAATPSAVTDKLANGFIRATKSPDIIKRLESEGSMMVGSTPAEFRKYIQGEVAQWRKVVQDNAIKVDES